MSQPFDYADSPYPVPARHAAAYRRAWRRIAAPGNWWRGAERVAIAAEVRRARDCALCSERKQALSPYAVEGRHQPSATLPAAAVEAVHRITTDSGRLKRAWYEELLADGLTPESYVELLGVLVQSLCIDRFHEALGLALEPLPDPEDGEPAGYRPPGAAMEAAWVPMIEGRNLGPNERDLYGERTGNVIRAMSLAPDNVRALADLSGVQYLTFAEMSTYWSGRPLDRAQMELIAGRVSALNECFY